jgi:hypothetical protein
MGPRWGQRVRRADPTRPIAGPVSSLTSANNFNAGASPPEKRKVAGSIPALATSEAISASVLTVTRRLFVAYADRFVQYRSHFRVHLAARHGDVLRHRRPRVAELVGPDPSREPRVVDQRGHRLAERMRGHIRQPERLADLAPLLTEVVRIAQRTRRGREDDPGGARPEWVTQAIVPPPKQDDGPTLYRAGVPRRAGRAALPAQGVLRTV